MPLNQVFTMKKKLSSVEKKALRKKAHALKPVVMIGQQGLTDAVLAEVNIALDTHELIKVRRRGVDQDKRTEQSKQFKVRLNAEVVHEIGGIIVLYRSAKISSSVGTESGSINI